MPRVIAVALLVACLGVAPSAQAAPTTTVQRTIQDCDGDNVLEYTFGERHVPFDTPFPKDCTPDQGDELRLPPSASFINFLQMSDFQTVDEESPGRVEFLDGSQRAPGLQPFSAAYRPQESLSTQVTEEMVNQARNTVSPVTGKKLDLTILTGDNADSQQFNETRWFIDTLDGTTGPGNPDPEMQDPDHRGQDRKIDPNSGIATTPCESTPGSVYDGVRDSGQPEPQPDFGYYEPDATSDRIDGDGYSPDRARNARETGRDVTVRDFPGLLEAANRPFEAQGLDMPWYTTFGNHDALIQGNSPQAYIGPVGPGGELADPSFNAVVTGCLKVMQPSADQRKELNALVAAARGATDPVQHDEAIGAVLKRANEILETPGEATTEIVPPDPRRCYVAKDDNALLIDPGLAPGPCRTGSWIKQHFRTTGTPVGHGLAPSDPADCAKYADEADACARASADLGPGLGRPPVAVANHDGYYSFVPKPGLRFLVLDTITDECGTLFCSEGSIDKDQFNWMDRQIDEAAAARQYVVLFSHHTLRTTRLPPTDPSEGPDFHFGERRDRRGNQPIPFSPGQTLEELYCRHPNVLAQVVGHEHENYVEHHLCANDRPDPTPGDSPGFWQISTASHMDFPQQARMIELVNMGGELSFVTTMLDHDGTANPGGAPAQSDQGSSGYSVQRLASISRELAYNDYQGSRGARGSRQDRNVILPTGRLAPPEFGVTP